MKDLLNFLWFFLLASFAGIVLAQTPDGQTPADEEICADFIGAAFGLCNAYCEAMDCELANDGDPSTEPSASPTACEKVKSRFQTHVGAGVELPCEQPTCPCTEDPTNWSALDAGLIWDGFVSGSIIPTACRVANDGTVFLDSDDGSNTTTVSATPTQCTAEDPLDSVSGFYSLLTAEEAEACQTELKFAIGPASCPPPPGV